MENRRFLLAAFLSAILLMVWGSLVMPPPPVQPAPEGPLAEDSSTPPRDSGSGGETGESPGGAFLESPDISGVASITEAEETPLLDFEEEEVAAQSEESFLIESALFRAEFSNRGAQLVSLRLEEDHNAAGEPLEIVKDRGADLYPFAVIRGDGKSHRLNSALFEVHEETSTDGRKALRFRHQSERGAAEKVFRLTPDGLLEVEVRIAGESGWSVLFGPGLRNPPASENEGQFVQRGVGYRSGEDLELIKASKTREDTAIPAFGLKWLSLEDNFFLVGIVPREGVQGAVIRPVVVRSGVSEGEPRFLPAQTEVEEEDATRDQLLLVQSAGEEMKLQTFFGAKRYSLLADQPYGLEQTVRWGMFGFLAKPLYYGLKWIYHELTPNYGWAIILITCLIKLLFFPLTHKSQDSMSKMQELNPKVQAIRTKFRSKLKDKQGRPNAEAQRQMNEEVMAVYKSAGVNPAAGCLPLLLQMPVFFAFFRVLSTAVELRGAPWLAWITDLSKPDQFFILPIVMGVTSIMMQKMMPSAADAMQRRMMQMMPIVFTVFALYFPAGLVLYWVTNNLLTMAQQALLLKMKKVKAEAAA